MENVPLLDPFYDIVSVSPVNPEKRLLSAILERLIMDIICEYSDPKIRANAIEWINSVPYDLGVLPDFSYPWICHHLDLNPIEFKSKILSISVKPSKNRKSSYRSMAY